MATEDRNRPTPEAAGSDEREPGRAPRVARNSAPRSDAAIRADLERRISASDEIDEDEIDLLVSHGRVTLLGIVPDFGTKRLIEALCLETSGVLAIRDQLRITPAGGLRAGTSRAGFRGSEK